MRRFLWRPVNAMLLTVMLLVPLLSSMTVPVDAASGPASLADGSSDGAALASLAGIGNSVNDVSFSNPVTQPASIAAPSPHFGFSEVLNQAATGTIKICKVAGLGVAVGELFRFTVTTPGGLAQTYDVPAGPAPGTCVLDGTFAGGT